MILTAVPAAAQKITVDQDSTVNFATFKTFGWSTGQVARNPIAAQMIIFGIENELISRGLTRSNINPDLEIMVMAAVGIDLQGVGPSWNNAQYKSWGGYGNPAALMNVASGTLLIDLVETVNKKSIWRGVAKDTLKNGLTGNASEDARKAEKQINNTIKKMFKKYPTAARS